MEINFSEILANCRYLASYEGRNMTAENGDSMYSLVRITRQDEDLITHYFESSCLVIEAALEYVIEDFSVSKKSLSINFTEDILLNTLRGLEKQIKETLTAEIMYRWLEDKSEERSKAYADIAANMLKSVIKNLSRKRPKL